MASSYLYALDNNDTDALEVMLVSKLIFLIYQYDKSIYTSSRSIKLTLCRDIPKYHISKIQLYLQNFKVGEAQDFKNKVLTNLEFIKNDLCNVDEKDSR